MKKELNSLGNLLQRYPNDPLIRCNFFYMKHNFSRLLKRSQSQCREKKFTKIEDMEKKNPTAFWNLVHKFRNQNNSDNIDPECFYEHFKTLHEGLNHNTFDITFKEKIKGKLGNLDKLIRVDILDKYITQDEIPKQIQKMPNKKHAVLMVF